MWSIGSFSNALRRVQRDISKNRAEEAVVYMPYNWSPSEDQDNDPSVIAIKRLLWSLVNRKWSFSWMLTPELHESVGLPAAFSLQYAIIAVGAVEAGYDSILTPYTYYGAKPEGAARGKANYRTCTGKWNPCAKGQILGRLGRRRLRRCNRRLRYLYSCSEPFARQAQTLTTPGPFNRQVVERMIWVRTMYLLNKKSSERGTRPI